MVVMKNVVSWDITLCSPLMEAIFSTKTLVGFQYAARRYISGDSILLGDHFLLHTLSSQTH
jgi:hypothetical protein